MKKAANKMDGTGFARIKKKYAELEESLIKSGRGLVYRTEKGIYGTSGMDRIHDFFRQIRLENCSSFLDLGSGDGRVVLIASLFTKATGIEFDKELSDKAKQTCDSLGMECTLIEGDYLKHDFTQYDIIFINPDHEFNELDEKLSKELKGTLFVYNEIFAPEQLKKGRKFWAGQTPIVSYTK